MTPADDLRHRHRGARSSQLLTGLFVTLIGVIFTLDNLGIVDAQDYLRYWPAAFVLMGLAKVWQSRDGHGGLGGIIFMAVGLWLLLERTVDIRISLSDMWPVLLVIFGGYLVWRGLTGRRQLMDQDGPSTISALAILSGVNRGSNSKTFRGGDVTAVMGGCEIDLRQAAINGEAVIEVFAMWGGIEIRVPEDWVVTTQATPLLGAVDDKTHPAPGSGAHRLTVRGFVLMGGVEIKN
jgi:predicted membrane protein